MMYVVLRCYYFQVMKHAGLAITITTVTDLVTFVISNFTTKFRLVRSPCHIIVRFLQVNFCREFCQFAIPSLSFVYLFMCTFFLAALAIDQRRVDAGRFWMTMMIDDPLSISPCTDNQMVQALAVLLLEI